MPEQVDPSVIRLVRHAIVVIVVAFAFGLPSNGVAQKSAKAERKVMVSVKPKYPDYLKRAQIGGVVRLKVTVAADGKVGFVNIVGGNPILAESGAAAVLKWNFAPAAAQTIEDVVLNFNPH